MAIRADADSHSSGLSRVREQSVQQWVDEYNQAEEQEMNLDELVPSTSNYLAKEDVGTVGKNLTISGFTRETVGKGQDADERAVVQFKEDVKPMVLNKTNKNRIKHYLQATDSNDVIGKVINVFNDPDIEFGGEIVGGLRIRGAQEIPAPNAAPSTDFLDEPNF